MVRKSSNLIFACFLAALGLGADLLLQLTLGSAALYLASILVIASGPNRHRVAGAALLATLLVAAGLFVSPSARAAVDRAALATVLWLSALISFRGSHGLIKSLRRVVWPDDVARISELLWEKESNLAQVQRIAQLGNWNWNIEQDSAACSEETCRILGQDPERFGATFEDFMKCVHPEDRLQVRQEMLAALHRLETFDILHRIVRPDGTVRLVHQLGEVDFDECNRPVQWIGTIQDVTELKAAEQALEIRAYQQAAVASLGQTALLGNSLDQLIDEAMSAIRVTLDLEFSCVLEYLASDDSFALRWGSGWSEGTVGRTGLASGADSPIRRTWMRQAPLVFGDLTEAGLESEAILHQHQVLSGVSVPIWGADSPVGVLGAYSQSKREFTKDDCHFMQAVSNILATAGQRRLNEARIQSSLKEKEVLLKELHHRVKNNLQIIQSMLNLQARRSRDPQAVRVLRDSQGRIRSISLIHEKLYRSKSLRWIPFGEYLRELMGLISQAHSFGATQIDTIVEAEDLDLDIETAIPCGLIVNELAFNALRHAFVGRPRGTVKVVLKRIETGLCVLVADDGSGFAFPSRPSPDGTLGLHLVHVLTDQLNGSIAGSVENGTRITLQIPLYRSAKDKDDFRRGESGWVGTGDENLFLGEGA